MPEPAIHVDHVWKKFRKGELHDSLRELLPAVGRRLIGRGPKSADLNDREFWALKDVSFEVQRGQSMGIIGPNGAGKSTMLKLLSRIIRPNRGSYRVNGRLSALIEVGAGFHQDLTGRENIYLNATILGMPRAEIKRKEAQIIDFAGVEEFIETPVKRYSSGMKARLGFAIAAHMDPHVLLVDEVLSVGDAKFRSKCIRHMRKLVESDVTVVFISHILDQVRALCPNTIVLDHGEKVYDGDTDGAIRTYLDLLGHGDDEDSTTASEAELRNITMCDAEGHEVLQWAPNEPGMLRFDLVLHKPVDEPQVLVSVSTITGVFLFTLNTRLAGVTLPTEVGEHRVQVMLDPVPMSIGDFVADFKIQGGPDRRVLWAYKQGRVLSVRGEGPIDGIVRCNARWQVDDTGEARHAS